MKFWLCHVSGKYQAYTPYGCTTHCYIAKYLLIYQLIYQSNENRCLVFDERAPAANTANDAAPS
jgi:hypothetical protein